MPSDSVTFLHFDNNQIDRFNRHKLRKYKKIAHKFLSKLKVQIQRCTQSSIVKLNLYAEFNTI